MHLEYPLWPRLQLDRISLSAKVMAFLLGKALVASIIFRAQHRQSKRGTRLAEEANGEVVLEEQRL